MGHGIQTIHHRPEVTRSVNYRASSPRDPMDAAVDPQFVTSMPFACHSSDDDDDNKRPPGALDTIPHEQPPTR